MKNKSKPINYVNNERLYIEMIKYKQLLEEHEKKGLTKPRIPEYIGECVLMIANNLTKHKSFNGYSPQWIEEMVSDGIENIIQYLHNFDPNKTKNPFAYFTQIIWYAFIRRIQKEKMQQYIKAKNLQKIAISESLNGETINDLMPTDALNDLIEMFENPNKNKKKSK